MKKGFTLIEILISVSIIALLVGISVYNFPRTGMKARNTRRLVDFEQIRGALESFRNNDINACYPSSVNELVTRGYLEELPRDPRTKSTYTFNYSQTCSSYQMYIVLEGGGNKYVVGTPLGTVTQPAAP